MIGNARQFFFMHLGGLMAIVVYFTILGAHEYSEEGLRAALPVALFVQTGYLALAWSVDELKQFDFGVWLLFAVGTLGVAAGSEPVVTLFRVYSPAIVFATFGLTALLPMLLGYDSFMTYYIRRGVPPWQQKLEFTARLSRVFAIFWVVLLFVCAALSAYAPRDPLYTALYPNLLVFGVGMTATWWLSALYYKLFPPDFPITVEPLIMGMPFFFDRRAASGVDAEIQFRVSGRAPGNYWLRIANGRCSSFEGEAPAPRLTVHTPDDVWLRIVAGQLDGNEALATGLYRAEGDAVILVSMKSWFPSRR